MNELDEALDDARTGGERGVTVLYRALNPSLLRYLRHHVRGVAEDLASECWVAAVQGLPDIRGDADDFRAWLFTVARRRVADHYRRASRSPTLVPLDTVADPVSSGVVEDEAITGLTAQQAIETLLADLPPDQAEVVLLRAVGDLSVERVAGIMGRSPGSVRVLQHRALRRLQKNLDPAVTK